MRTRTRSVVAVYVFTFVIAACLIVDVHAEDVTLSTDKGVYGVYKVGEVVSFSGAGYSPSGTRYSISIAWRNETSGEETPVAYVNFTSVSVKGDEGTAIIPGGTSWSIPFDALSGTYVARVYNITDEDQFEDLKSSTEFFINASEAAKLEYASGVLEELIGTIEGGVGADEEGLIQSLLSSLENAAKKVENATNLLADGEYKRAANQLRAARNMLTAFVHKVVAQTDRIGKDLTDELIQKAMGLLGKVDSLLGTLFEESVPAGKRLSINMRRTLAKQELGLCELVIRKHIEGTEDEEELMAFLNSTVARLGQVINQSKTKRSELGALDLNLSDIAMELEGLDQVTNNTLHLFEVLMRQVEKKGELNPGLAKKLSEIIASTSDGEEGAQELSRRVGKDLEEIRGKAWGRRGTPPGKEKHKGEGGGGGG